MTSTHPPATSNVRTGPAFDRFILVHGFGADIDSHWFPWLARELPELERIELPDPHRPVAQKWITCVRERIGHVSATTALVTHSLGGITTLRALPELAAAGDRLGALVMVAPFAQPLPVTGAANVDTFVQNRLPEFLTGYDPSQVRRIAEHVTCVRSDDDYLVPAHATDALADGLGAEIVVIPGAGHFLADDGVTRVDPLLPLLGRGTGR